MSLRSAGRIVVFALILAAAAPLLFADRLQPKMRDFEVYWTAGARTTAGESLYRPEDGHYQFKYLPGFAVAMAPVSILPLSTAKLAWFGFSVACLVGVIALSVALVPAPTWRRSAIAALTVVAMAKFAGHELILGQVNLLFGVICLFGLVALVKRRDLAAGLCFGLAAIVKPYAVVFLVYLLLIRRWRAALAGVGGVLIALAVPVPVYGIAGTAELLSDWWRTAFETSAPLLTNADATSAFAMYAKWIGWGPVAAASAVVTLGVCALALLWVIARRAAVASAEVLETALVLTLIPLATPQGWDYALLLSTPLVAILIDRTRTMPRADRLVTVLALALVAFSLYDVMGRAAYRAFMGLSAITVCYLALIAVAVRLRLRAAA